MLFTGLPLSQILLIGAVAGLATVALYILKMRRRAVPVPFAKIWARLVKDQDATSLFSQLKRLLSLLIQLALLALLLFALGDPRMAASLVSGRNVVVLLDASASMKATDTLTAASRIEAAKNEVKTLARGLSGSDRMLVAQMDAAVTPLSTLTSDVIEIEAGVGKVHATDARADFPRALRFATDTLRGLSKAEIIVVSDGALGLATDSLGEVGLGDIKLSLLPVGKALDSPEAVTENAAISQFSVRRYPLDRSRYEVMLEVTNTSDVPMELSLTLLGDGEIVDITRLKLQPHERLPRFYPNLSGANRTLEATIQKADGGHDALPADDHAYALLPERRRVKVQAVTPGNTYLEAALLLDEYLDVTVVTPENYPAKGRFEVTIFDGAPPKWLDGSGAGLYLNPSGEFSPVKLGKELEDFGFDDWEKKSPLLRWMVLDTIGVNKGFELLPEKEDRAVGTSIDERTGKKRPILVSGRRESRFVALGFDPRDSDIVLRIAWPLFLLNTINDFVEDDARYLSSYRTGEVWHVPAPPVGPKGTVTLIAPDKSERSLTVQDGRAVILGLDAGFYTLRGGTKEAPQDFSFAANLADVTESSITPKKTLLVGGKEAGAVAGFTIGVRREVWIYLLLAALLLTALEWFTYHRRVTV
jgi:Ca-activated chloride channel homolog